VKNIALVFLLVVLLALGLGVRMVDADKPPLDFMEIRQYRSLMLARALYFDSQENIAQERKEIAKINAEVEETLEPTIAEHLTVMLYRVAGGERFWIPRLMSSLFWTIGGVFLYLIGKRLTTQWASIASVAIYLFLPPAVPMSRAFMPDPLMVMCTLISIFMILSWHETPSQKRLVLTAAIASISLLVKIMAVFPVLFTFLAVYLHKHGLKIRRELLIFLASALTLPGIYYIYGLFIAGFLKGQARMSFIPSLLVSKFFWSEWARMVTWLIGYSTLIPALLGIPLSKKGLPRATIIGLWLSYLAFCLVFHYHTPTHPYYSIMLVPIAALSIGAFAVPVIDRLSPVVREKKWLMVLTGLLALGFYVNLIITLEGVRYNEMDDLKVKQAQKIGNLIGHTRRCIFLTRDNGVLLRYHGEISGMSWPCSWDLRLSEFQGGGESSAQNLLGKMKQEADPLYFIVTDRQEFYSQNDLVDILHKHKSVTVDGAIVFYLKE
jgi:hypothetical protein